VDPQASGQHHDRSRRSPQPGTSVMRLASATEGR
jgi:hypothetical protein